MKPGTRELHQDVERIVSVLDRGSFLCFAAAERQALRLQADELSRRLTALEGRSLTVGLLGGTGVGKSTVMNALAGNLIASTSHRRPHTDRVLIYRHTSVQVPPTLLAAEVPWEEITHGTETVKQVILCDLPDFDSLLGEHRERVLAFLEHLDLLVWVASPEKYADGRFYEFLRVVAKAPQNFSFVLNKADLFFQGETQETGYERLAGVSRTFRQHIDNEGITDPLLFVLSSQEALPSGELSPWNQFPAFRQYVFQQREIKEITAIKGANLDVEVQNLSAVLEGTAVHLERAEGLIGRLDEELAAHRTEWRLAAEEVFALWLGTHLRHKIQLRHADPSLLVGPGRALGLVSREWERRFGDEGKSAADHTRFALPPELASSLRRRVEWLQERLLHTMHREALPAALQSRLETALDLPKRVGDLEERLSQTVMLRLTTSSSLSAWGFKARQYVAYLLLLAALFVAIGAETSWRETLADPGPQSALGLFLSAVRTVFSGQGIAALASYALLNLFVAFRFHARYRRLLHKRVEKTIEALATTLLQIWSETLDEIDATVKELRSEIHAEIAAVRPRTFPSPTDAP
ncbi:MAG TPA: GTPase domain-containing protein [Syntrophobacteria bacterium]|nr:GTPase domain-containing protein [Syntrophobacteria bacterium]